MTSPNDMDQNKSRPLKPGASPRKGNLGVAMLLISLTIAVGLYFYYFMFHSGILRA